MLVFQISRLGLFKASVKFPVIITFEILIIRASYTNLLGFKKLLDNVKKQYDERQERKRIEDHEFQQYKDQVNGLLDQFEIPQLGDFLIKYVNNKPEPSKEKDKDSGRIYTQRPSRRDYLDFTWEHMQ